MCERRQYTDPRRRYPTMNRKRSQATLDDTRTLSVDIGGTGIKAIILNDQGDALTERGRVETPRPATPRAILRVIDRLAAQGPFDRISVGFPGVVRNGVTKTAPNLDEGWQNFALAKELGKRFKRPVRVANDADVQGFGAIDGHGVELVLTLGTGLGSALFVDGTLVPNLELAHHRFRRGKTYEEQLGNAALKKAGKGRWNKRLRRALRTLELLFSYDRVYLGGGNAKKITGALPPKTKTVANIAGLLGGIALWRANSSGEKAVKRQRR